MAAAGGTFDLSAVHGARSLVREALDVRRDQLFVFQQPTDVHVIVKGHVRARVRGVGGRVGDATGVPGAVAAAAEQVEREQDGAAAAEDGDGEERRCGSGPRPWRTHDGSGGGKTKRGRNDIDPLRLSRRSATADDGSDAKKAEGDE